MPPGTGRKKDVAWEAVLPLENDTTRVTCKYCLEAIQRKIERVKAHLNKCKKKKEYDAAAAEEDMDGIEADSISSRPASATPRPSSSMTIMSNVTDLSDISLPSTSESELTLTTSTPVKSCKKQKTLHSFVTKTDTNFKNQLDLSLAKFSFSSNVSFNAIENENLKKFCSLMRPGYEPPKRKKLSGELLDKIYDETTTEVKDAISGMAHGCLTLMQDGWSSVRNDPILAHCIHTLPFVPFV